MTCLLQMRHTAAKINIPTQIQVGSDDTCFNPDSWEPLLEAIACEDKVMRIYPGARHAVYNDIDKQITLNDLKAWINQHNRAKKHIISKKSA